MKVLKKITTLFALSVVAFCVNAESLEERVESLEETVQLLVETVDALMQQLGTPGPVAEGTAVENVQAEPKPQVIAVAEGTAERSSETVVSAYLLNLMFNESNAANDYTNDYQDWISIGFMFTSALQKTTRAVKGDIIFADLFGEEWWRVGLTVTDPLIPEEGFIWLGSINYNMYEDAHA